MNLYKKCIVTRIRRFVMNKKQVISLLLAVILVVGLMAVPAAAEESKAPESGYPFVFVHGLLGFGERADANTLLPYWGMSSGSIVDYLTRLGYESYAAQVGPISSAWDRACELYAQLTGTTVDYGIAHSAEKDHARFGVTYDKPLFSGWGPDKKINLVGHSFGGASIRMFLDILADGCPEEVAAAEAAGEKVSPFFEGGKSNWVYSLTAIAAPHNGTTFFEACKLSSTMIPALIYDYGSALKMTPFSNFYDLQLEHFGVSRNEGESDQEYLTRVLYSEKYKGHHDNALEDLTIDCALDINDGIEIRDDIYYFSVAGDTTHDSKDGNKRVPNDETFVLAKGFSSKMGKYCGKYTAGGFYIDESWLPNDGLVNVVSALYPVNSSGECLKQDGSCGYAFKEWDSTEFEKGVWNVMPVVPYDHIAIVGGVFNNSMTNVRALYLDIVENIVSTYDGGAVSDPVLSSFTFKFIDNGMWAQLFHMIVNARNLLAKLFM